MPNIEYMSSRATCGAGQGRSLASLGIGASGRAGLRSVCILLTGREASETSSSGIGPRSCASGVGSPHQSRGALAPHRLSICQGGCAFAATIFVTLDAGRAAARQLPAVVTTGGHDEWWWFGGACLL
jgi:hypothetical protein